MSATQVRVPAEPAGPVIRELVVVREIAHALLTTDRPEEVFQFALARVSPLVDASFASVYLVERGEDLMRLAAAHNWPERYRPFLGEMRVRLGQGPSGEAAAGRRVVYLPDVFADYALEHWQDVARELGFRAIVALPLQTRNRVVGAVAFYFAETVELNTGEHGLLRTVADQIAAAVEKASLIDELRRANAALVESNAELERQYIESLAARRLKDEFLATMSHELRTPLTAVLGHVGLLQEGLSGPLTDAQQRTLTHVTKASERLLSLIEDVLELAALKRGDALVHMEQFDPGDVLCEAVAAATGRAPAVALRVSVPDTMLPLMRSDRRKVLRILVHLLNNAYKFTSAGEVSASVDVRDGMVYFGIKDTGMGITPEARRIMFEEFRQADGSRTRQHGGSGVGLALSRRLALLLGGDIQFQSPPSQGSWFVVELPLECAVEAERESLAMV